MKRLFELAERSVGKVFYSVSGGTHNDTWEVAAEDYHRVSVICADRVFYLSKLL